MSVSVRGWVVLTPEIYKQEFIMAGSTPRCLGAQYFPNVTLMKILNSHTIGIDRQPLSDLNLPPRVSGSQTQQPPLY